MNMDALLAWLSRIGNAIAGFVREHGSWLLFAALALLLLALLIYALRSKSRWLQLGPNRLGSWSLDLVRGLRYLSTRREWRYHSPWVLMAGDPDAGKSSVTQSIQNGRRSNLLLREAHLAVADSEWGFFDGGVVTDGDARALRAGGRCGLHLHQRGPAPRLAFGGPPRPRRGPPAVQRPA